VPPARWLAAPSPPPAGECRGQRAMPAERGAASAGLRAARRQCWSGPGGQGAQGARGARTCSSCTWCRGDILGRPPPPTYGGRGMCGGTCRIADTSPGWSGLAAALRAPGRRRLRVAAGVQDGALAELLAGRCTGCSALAGAGTLSAPAAPAAGGACAGPRLAPCRAGAGAPAGSRPLICGVQETRRKAERRD
jgi:hypothetical protein